MPHLDLSYCLTGNVLYCRFMTDLRKRVVLLVFCFSFINVVSFVLVLCVYLYILFDVYSMV